LKVKHRAITVTLALLAFGYIGAWAFYSYLLGLSGDFPYACPVCANIDSLGPPFPKFIWRTMAFGTLNAALFAAVGWTLIGIALGLKRVSSGRSIR
jgi:hypothetical protein